MRQRENEKSIHTAFQKCDAVIGEDGLEFHPQALRSSTVFFFFFFFFTAFLSQPTRTFLC
jgi:hypothetical protein